MGRRLVGRTLDQTDQKQLWGLCLADDLRVILATNGIPKRKLFFGVGSRDVGIAKVG